MPSIGRKILATLAITLFATFAFATPNGLVVLLTDYGADSIYVGAIKGAMYNQWPGVRIDSITNSVPNFDIETGARMLAEAAPLFPTGTVFCCVVDPGVGTARKVAVVETKSGHYFVGPDNGLIALAAGELEVASLHEGSNMAYWRVANTSHTFQGRDIFGPVAASVAKGVPLDDLGPAMDTLAPTPERPISIANGVITGRVSRMDDYGNVVMNITAKDLETIGAAPGAKLKVNAGDSTLTLPFLRTYSDVAEGERLALIQSAGYMELAINKGSFAEASKVKQHGEVTVELSKD